MKKRIIKVAFYKKSKSLFGRLIRFKQYRLQRFSWRHAQYSHSELAFDDRRWYSSFWQDKGVRAKQVIDFTLFIINLILIVSAQN